MSLCILWYKAAFYIFTGGKLMNKNGRNRIFGLLFALCLLAATMPAALAESNGGDVAKIEGTGVSYPSIRAAVDAATDGDTVVVTRNHVINCGIPSAARTASSRWMGNPLPLISTERA